MTETEKKMISAVIPDITRMQLEQISNAENISMTQSIIKAVEYYYEQYLMRDLITKLYSFKGKMVDQYYGKFDINPKLVDLLAVGKYDELIKIVKLWMEIPKENNDAELISLGLQIINLIQNLKKSD